MDDVGIIIIFVVIALIIIVCLILAIKGNPAEKQFVSDYQKIEKGMSEEQVIAILGNNYTRSSLKNDVEKLEWRFRVSGFSYGMKGFRSHSSGYTRRVSVKFKNGIVIEISALNMD